jgi:hypothetical protein
VTFSRITRTSIDLNGPDAPPKSAVLPRPLGRGRGGADRGGAAPRRRGRAARGAAHRPADLGEVGDVLAHHPDLDRLERAGRAAEIGRAVEARVPAGSPALSDEDVAAQIEEERRLAAEAGRRAALPTRGASRSRSILARSVTFSRITRTSIDLNGPDAPLSDEDVAAQIEEERRLAAEAGRRAALPIAPQLMLAALDRDVAILDQGRVALALHLGEVGDVLAHHPDPPARSARASRCGSRSGPAPSSAIRASSPG